MNDTFIPKTEDRFGSSFFSFAIYSLETEVYSSQNYKMGSVEMKYASRKMLLFVVFQHNTPYTPREHKKYYFLYMTHTKNICIRKIVTEQISWPFLNPTVCNTQ